MIRLLRRALLPILALPFILASSRAADSAVRTQTEEERFASARAKAEQGDTRSQYILGLMYMGGRGVTKDNALAVEWFRKAADKGDPFGQNSLGRMYEYGMGVAQDYAAALDWYRKSIAQGNAGAQISLGFAYANGHGVPKDDAEAASCYRKAADQGLSFGQFLLGQAYEKGLGVPQDQSEALSWYRKAAEKGDPTAKRKLAALGLGPDATAADGGASAAPSPARSPRPPEPMSPLGMVRLRRLGTLGGFSLGDEQDLVRLYRSFIAASVIEAIALVGLMIGFFRRRSPQS
jgi:TPR repeat protein